MPALALVAYLFLSGRVLFLGIALVMAGLAVGRRRVVLAGASRLRRLRELAESADFRQSSGRLKRVSRKRDNLACRDDRARAASGVQPEKSVD